MPLFILLVGILLVFAGLNDKIGELGRLVKEDFAPSDGTTGFPIWIAVIFVIGAIGYVKELKPISNAFLLLVFVVLIISNRGFFAKFTAAIKG